MATFGDLMTMEATGVTALQILIYLLMEEEKPAE
jgi:hypothetical protein